MNATVEKKGIKFLAVIFQMDRRLSNIFSGGSFPIDIDFCIGLKSFPTVPIFLIGWKDG